MSEPPGMWEESDLIGGETDATDENTTQLISRHIANADDDTPSTVIAGHVIPSGMAMRRANEWAAKTHSPVPYPDLGRRRRVLSMPGRL